MHARGMAAKGVFEVTHDVSDLTYADFLSQVGHPTALRHQSVQQCLRGNSPLQYEKDLALEHATTFGWEGLDETARK